MRKLFFISACVLVSCNSNELLDDPIPFGTFEPLIINITLPAYSKLQVDGNYIVLASIGNRGVIIYRENSRTFRAFEQNCSFQPTDVSANVEPRPFNMVCTGCNSTFNYDGEASGGFAWRPLLQYEVRVSGTTLTITDTVINY